MKCRNSAISIIIEKQFHRLARKVCEHEGLIPTTGLYRPMMFLTIFKGRQSGGEVIDSDTILMND